MRKGLERVVTHWSPAALGRGLARLARDEEGQAVVEYILMVSVTIAAVGALSFGFRKTLFRIWGLFAQEISAACPGCPPDPQIRLR
jgi:Flp pilus assembly pilin Flp